MPSNPTDLWAGKSPWVAGLFCEYQLEGLDKWDNARVEKCAILLGCPVADLCAIAGLFDKVMIARFQRNDSWPIFLTVQWSKMERFKRNYRMPDKQDQRTAQLVMMG